MNKINVLSTLESDYVSILSSAGYQSVFDVIKSSRATFAKAIPDIDPCDAHRIYRDARQRAETLKQLFRSWQLRQEPLIANRKKLGVSSGEELYKVIEKTIGGEHDFHDLMERSAQYADAASIQSMFSPGRYAASLYLVAKAFNNVDGVSIDERRPDIKDLILSEATMNQEVTSLDILLEVLQKKCTLAQLSDCFYPMTLPYDDGLSQIEASLKAQGRTLSGIWETLTDTEYQSFNPIKMASASQPEEGYKIDPKTRNALSLTPKSYELIVKPTEGRSVDDILAHYGNVTMAELNDISIFCRGTSLSFNQLLELTAQSDYNVSSVNKDESVFYKYSGSGEADKKVVTVQEYGAALINSAITGDSLRVQPETWASGEIKTKAELNIDDAKNTDNTLVRFIALAGSVEKLIRLRNSTNLSFEMLDWLIANVSTTVNNEVLKVLASCVALQKRYGISVNTFVSFVGAINPYARKQEKSSYETLFTSLDGTFTPPIGANLDPADGQSRALLCKAVGVSDDELCRILKYCGLSLEDAFLFDEKVAGRLYRFGEIPRMLGLTFTEAECLWTLMESGQTTALKALGADNSSSAIDLISRTEHVLAWMADNELNLIQLQAMVSTTHSSTATPEMFNFLQNIYDSNPLQNIYDSNPHKVVTSSNLLETNDALPKVLHSVAGGLGVKTNIAKALMLWLEKRKALTGDFSLAEYWHQIVAIFGGDGDITLDSLQNSSTLVLYTHLISQLVLIVKWLDLNEQDLSLLTETPSQLDGRLNRTADSAPDMALLLLLTRFKRWQTQVTVPRDEALQLLPLLGNDEVNVEDIAAKIATMHDLHTDTVQAMMDDTPPKDFSQLWQLLTWARTGQMLNVGALVLKDLLIMSEESGNAELESLIDTVASNLTAGLVR